MNHTHGGMTPEDQKIAGEALQTALVDLLCVSLQGKQAHWNVTGRHFRSLHLQLDELVALARQHADTLAERAVAIGVHPDGRAATVARDTAAPFGPGPIADEEVILRVIQLLAEIIGRLREGIRDTEQADPVTQDLLIAVSHDLQKQHWMFAAQSGAR